MYKRNKRAQPMAEDFRIEIDKVFKEFLNDTELTSYTFPTNLNNQQRKYIHERCRVLGFKSKSHGVEPNRAITVTKKDRTDLQINHPLCLSDKSNDALNTFAGFNAQWVSSYSKANKKFQRNYNHRFSYGAPVIPERPATSPFGEFRMNLPIFPLKETILNLLQSHQVLIVSAETGSGKTTQVPQYLLEQATSLNKPCRIICTQPRRISTIAVSERVAAERGEQLGNTVGYQIKLDSKMSQKTSLLYCTNGVLLKTLMNINDNYEGITHVVVDEIHERDKYSDFLLICLREQLKKSPNMRVVLMSASMDIDSLVKYFPGSEAISIPGRLFPISNVYLGEILKTINYESNAMRAWKSQRQQDTNPSVFQKPEALFKAEDFVEEMSMTIRECIETGSEDSFMQLQQLIISEGNSVNYVEEIDGFTAIFAAALHGRLDIVEQLSFMGADVSLKTTTGQTCIDAAKSNGHITTCQFLEALMQNKNIQNPQQPQQPQEDILKLYNETIFDDNIDFNLIQELVIYIHEKVDPLGGILIFLPGYEDILMSYDYLSNSALNMDKVEIFMLHGSMQIGAQHKVFKRLHNKQKIVLATNVAETSITIDDICFVIDTGRAKEKTYDATANTHSLTRTWISKACIKQRSGRAGRTRNGICFHLFSELRYNALMENSTPEILRVPLEEICLQTKAFAPSSMNIATFLSLALQPPAPIAIEKAIQSLVLLGALDENEKLTTLGSHLLQLSLMPNLAKMLIYGVIFKCLEPVLTIVASLNQKDPFILPSAGSDKTQATNMRRELSENTFSDHMSFLRAYQKWQEAKSQNREYKFCKEYFVSASSMTTIQQTRNQLMSQLKTQGFITPKDSFQDLNLYSESWPMIKAALLTGIYPQLAFLENGMLSTRTEKKVVCHVSSSIQKNVLKTSTANSSWFMYDELSKIGTLASMKNVTLISPATICLVGGESQCSAKEVAINGWLSFETINENLQVLRRAVDRMVSEKVEHPAYVCNEYKHILENLRVILLDEDVVIGLPQPQDITVKQFPHRNRQQNFQQDNFHQNRRYNEAPHASSSQNWRDRSNIPPSFRGRGNFQGPRMPHNQFRGSQKQFWQNPSSHFERPRCELSQNAKYFYISENISGGMLLVSHLQLNSDTCAKVQDCLQNNTEVVLMLSPRNSGYFVGMTKVAYVSKGYACGLQWLCQKKVFFSDIRERAKLFLKQYQEGEELDVTIGGKISQIMMQL